MRARSAAEFRRVLRLDEAFFDRLLPFKARLEADFQLVFKSAVLREPPAAADAFARNELLHQL